MRAVKFLHWGTKEMSERLRSDSLRAQSTEVIHLDATSLVLKDHLAFQKPDVDLMDPLISKFMGEEAD